MTPLSVKEIHNLANAIVSVEYTDDVRELLDRFEAGSVGLEEVLEQLRHAPGRIRQASFNVVSREGVAT